MKTIRFKSNLKCNGCVNAIKPGMESIDEIKSWRVFLDVNDKIIEVETDGNTDKIAANIEDVVTKAGYKVERLED
ncbi:MAG: heavy-metal-associated domain-containing protein [Bacteroidetes bacterium]|nr:heavy-metal-associated domain-containing protein [Bacteroidota bacterium]